jgi:hypothetical protein
MVKHEVRASSPRVGADNGGLGREGGRPETTESARPIAPFGGRQREAFSIHCYPNRRYLYL